RGAARVRLQAGGLRVALPASPAVREPPGDEPGGAPDRGNGGPAVGHRPDLRRRDPGRRRDLRCDGRRPRVRRGGATMRLLAAAAAAGLVLACLRWHALVIPVVLIVLALVLLRASLFSHLPSRRARWRIRFRLRPAPGFASLAELA